jgi:hypothetical protein
MNSWKAKLSTALCASAADKIAAVKGRWFMAGEFSKILPTQERVLNFTLYLIQTQSRSC